MALFPVFLSIVYFNHTYLNHTYFNHAHFLAGPNKISLLQACFVPVFAMVVVLSERAGISVCSLLSMLYIFAARFDAIHYPVCPGAIVKGNIFT